MPLYLRKSKLRRVGEWFLAVRDRASSWMVIFGFMAVCRWVVFAFYSGYWALVKRKKSSNITSDLL
jgi:hypothetical protein